MNFEDAFENACQAIIARCREIRAACTSNDGDRLFAGKEVRKTVDICVCFLTAVADCPIDTLIPSHTKIVLVLRDEVLATNGVLAGLTRLNPSVINGISVCESTLFDLLLKADPTLRIMAGIAESHLTLVRAVLTAAFTGLGQLLAANGSKGKRRRKRLVDIAVQNLLLKRIGVMFEKYAADTRRQLSKTEKSIIRATTRPPVFENEIKGPRTEDCRQLVSDVITYLADPANPQSIHQACKTVFVKLPNGYSSAHALFKWCIENEHKVWHAVESIRLQ